MSLLPIALILGVVEGITEFLPVSSTGHLILVSHVLGFSGRRAQVFEIFMQLGAILAVVWEYRGMLFPLARDLVGGRQSRVFAGRLLLAFVPFAFAGFAVHEFISANLFRPVTVAAALVAGAIAIFVVESRRLRSRTFETRAVDTRQALLIGLCQCAALWPGFSRSAATILGGMLAGLDRRTATEFSFLIAIPTMLAATGYELLAHHAWLEAGDVWGLGLALVVSFAIALATLRWLIRYVASHDLRPFAWYRLALGVAVLLLLRGR